MLDPRLGLALRRMREARKLSLRDLEDATGVSFTTIGSRERGKLGMDDDDIDAYLKAIGANRKDLERTLADVVVPTKATDTIPLLPSVASAGRSWLDRGDAHEFPQGVRMIPRGSRATHPQAFGVTVEGTSMEPFFQNGDIIICEPIVDEHDVDRLRNDRTVVAWALPAVKQSTNGKPPPGAVVIPPAGCIGLWTWQPDRSALLRKRNGEHPPVWIPAQHDGHVFLAVVVEFTRPVW